MIGHENLRLGMGQYVLTKGIKGCIMVGTEAIS